MFINMHEKQKHLSMLITNYKVRMYVAFYVMEQFLCEHQKVMKDEIEFTHLQFNDFINLI